MICSHEETRRSWYSINYSQGKNRIKGISVVEVLNDGEWKTINDQESVEASIVYNNSGRYHLTKSTSLMSKYMREKLWCLAQNELA